MLSKKMSGLCIALIAGLSVSVTGCKTGEADVRATESTQAEHPQGEHPKAEHPSSEHPSRN